MHKNLLIIITTQVVEIPDKTNILLVTVVKKSSTENRSLIIC